MSKIVIVGGGIAGLASGIALASRGRKIALYERANSGGDVGGAIVLRPAATEVLQKFGVLERLLERSEALLWSTVLGADGDTIRHWRLPVLATPTVFCRRSVLHAVLHEKLGELGAEIVQNKAFDSFSRGTSGLFVRFSDGEETAAEALVGADGIRSSVREQVAGDGPPRYRGYVQWRYLSDRRHSEVPVGDKVEWWGRGVRFGAGHVGLGTQFYISINSRVPEFHGGADPIRFFRATFGEWAQPVPRLVGAITADRLIWTPIYDREPGWNWGAGPVTLVGDAAHAFTPDLGLGGGVAIEDADELGRRAAGGAPIAVAFREYEKSRMRRANEIYSQSRLFGAMAQWSNPVAANLRNLMLRNCPESIWQRRLRNAYYSDYAG